MAEQSTFIPFGGGSAGGGVSPQGFDLGQFAQQLAGQAAQALPGLIMGLLSAHPTIGAQVRAQSASPQGVSPQGFHFGQFAQQLAGQVGPMLPGLIMGLLSAHPTIGAQVRAQSASPQGVSPQSLFNVGINTPFGGGGISLFGASPAAGVSPQGFDLGQFAQQLAGQVGPMLPSLIMGLLSAHPTIGAQVRAQSASPQGVSPQGFDFGQFAQQLAGQAAQALPGLIMGLLSAHPTIGAQVRAQSASPFGASPAAGVSPQGFDLGQFAQQLAGQVGPMLPRSHHGPPVGASDDRRSGPGAKRLATRCLAARL